MNRDVETAGEDPDCEDRAIASLLRAVGRREAMPEGIRQKWEQHFRSELRSVIDRLQWRRRLVFGLCAGLAAIAITLVMGVPQPATPDISIRILQVRGESYLHRNDGTTLLLQAGQGLNPGSQISSGNSALLSLVYGRHNLRLNNNTRVELGHDRVLLLSGEIFASDEASVAQKQAITVETRHGSIRDIGTQFLVALYPDRTVTTVRKGALLINTADRQFRTAAIPGKASRLVLFTSRQVQRESVDPTGVEWEWIYQAAPAFDLDGKSVYEFLQWSANETGRHLLFASTAAESYARTTVLHGDLGNLNPEQAVGPVLITTDLEVKEGSADTLRLRLKSGI